jgi:PAS domain S-box-containing protein
LQADVSAPRVSEFVRASKASILDEWERSVRELPIARHLPHPVLVDEIPEILDRMAAMADDLANGRKPVALQLSADAHARARLEVGFDLREVMAEYAALRKTIAKHVWESQALQSPREALALFDQIIDAAMTLSVERYTYARDFTLQAIDRIATASLESKNVDELLERLLQVLLETTASVDTAAVFLVEGEELSCRAAVRLEAKDPKKLCLELGRGFAEKVAAERRPLLLRPAKASSTVEHADEREAGVRALYGIPLLENGHLLGVAQMGSHSAEDFSTQDTQLFSTLAGRASAAIFQHLLREHLESEQARMAAILEQMPAGIIIAEAPSGKLLRANRRVAEIWRRPFIASDSVEAYGAWKGFHPEDRRPFEPEEWALSRAVTRGEVVLDQEVEIERGDGTRGYILNNGAPIRDHEGQVVGGVVAFIDITERRNAELELKSTLSQLDTERIRFLHLVNNLDDAVVWEADAATRRFSFVSTRAEALTGWSVQDWMGDPDFWARHVPVPDHAMLVAMFERARERLTDDRCEHRFIDRAGRERWLHTGVHVTSRNGIVELQGVSVDITNLRAALRAREEVLSVVSHDLRNPLWTIVMNASMLARSASGSESRHLLEKSVDTILRSAKQMTRMIDDLLDVASIEAGRLSVKRKREDARLLMMEAVASMELLAAQKHVRVRADAPELVPPVLCDHDRVAQVFSNLLGNAVKVTPPGGTIEVRAEVLPGVVRYAVRDTGPGIHQEELHRIFERYWRGSAAEYKGGGLGLAIARGLVLAHGGRIWAESTVGAGSTFFFTIPTEPSANFFDETGARRP